MTRFYIYSSAKDELEIVEKDSLGVFAEKEFDPETMLFIGVVIEAKDFDTALKVYRNPTCKEGEYMMDDEPLVTVAKRQTIQESFDIIKTKLEYTRAYIKMQTATLKLREVNILLNDAAQQLYKAYGSPESHSPEQIFKQLSKIIDTGIRFNG